MAKKLVYSSTALAMVAVALGAFFAGRWSVSGGTLAEAPGPNVQDASQARPAQAEMENPIATLDSTQDRVPVPVSPPPAASVVAKDETPVSPIDAVLQTSGRMFEQVAYYEKSPLFNPDGRVLARADRDRLSLELQQLENRAVRAEARAMVNIESAAKVKRDSGGARPVDSDAVSVAPGALATQLSLTAEGVTAVDIYPEEVPEADRLKSERDAIREQGLALIHACFQGQ